MAKRFSGPQNLQITVCCPMRCFKQVYETIIKAPKSCENPWSFISLVFFYSDWVQHSKLPMSTTAMPSSLHKTYEHCRKDQLDICLQLQTSPWQKALDSDILCNCGSPLLRFRLWIHPKLSYEYSPRFWGGTPLHPSHFAVKNRRFPRWSAEL